jgi:hypothetical protein
VQPVFERADFLCHGLQGRIDPALHPFQAALENSEFVRLLFEKGRMFEPGSSQRAQQFSLGLVAKPTQRRGQLQSQRVFYRFAAQTAKRIPRPDRKSQVLHWRLKRNNARELPAPLCRLAVDFVHNLTHLLGGKTIPPADFIKGLFLAAMR